MILHFRLTSIVISLFLVLLAGTSYGQGPAGAKYSSENYIDESRFIALNGIDQWVTIKGVKAKPVILFLHGGPGSPQSPYADALYEGWENDFILVQWDQRGSGKTYGRNAPAEFSIEYCKSNPLTVQQITADGIALAEYLINHLAKQKIILFGTSWGSVPGIKMAAQRPELFYAYVGHSQVVNPAENIKQSYATVLQMAKDAGDAESLSILYEIGMPPYSRARNTGKLMRIIKKYEKQHVVPPPASWMSIQAEYNNEQDELNRSDGDDYSFLNYVGDSELGVAPMTSQINLMQDNMRFDIPIYFIQGQQDILTTWENTKEYFDKISAPKKEYILLPNAAHGFNADVLEAKKQIFSIIVP